MDSNNPRAARSATSQGTAIIDPVASLFVSHGAPTLVLEERPARHFLASLGATLPRPRALLLVTAHWETQEVALSSAAAPATVHDFSGFGPVLEAMRYAAPGAAELAYEVERRLREAGFAATCDAERGYDHGTWIPLACMYPDADVPVLQMSVCPARSPLHHWRLGRALAGLAAEGVLVIGSGALTHNLADWRAQRGTPAAESVPAYVDEFSTWVAARIAAHDVDALLAYHERAPHAARAHPSPEHLLPLFVALGAAGVSWRGERLHHSRMYGVVAMDCYAFRSGTVTH